MKKNYLAIASIVVAGAVLAACGGKDNTNATPTTVTPSSVSPSTSTGSVKVRLLHAFANQVAAAGPPAVSGSTFANISLLTAPGLASIVSVPFRTLSTYRTLTISEIKQLEANNALDLTTVGLIASIATNSAKYPAFASNERYTAVLCATGVNGTNPQLFMVNDTLKPGTNVESSFVTGNGTYVRVVICDQNIYTGTAAQGGINATTSDAAGAYIVDRSITVGTVNDRSQAVSKSGLTATNDGLALCQPSVYSKIVSGIDPNNMNLYITQPNAASFPNVLGSAGNVWQCSNYSDPNAVGGPSLGTALSGLSGNGEFTVFVVPSSSEPLSVGNYALARPLFVVAGDN